MLGTFRRLNDSLRPQAIEFNLVLTDLRPPRAFRSLRGLVNVSRPSQLQASAASRAPRGSREAFRTPHTHAIWSVSDSPFTRDARTLQRRTFLMKTLWTLTGRTCFVALDRVNRMVWRTSHRVCTIKNKHSEVLCSLAQRSGIKYQKVIITVRAWTYVVLRV